MSRKEGDYSVLANAKARHAMYTKPVFSNGGMQIVTMEQDITGIAQPVDSSIESKEWNGDDGYEVEVNILSQSL